MFRYPLDQQKPQIIDHHSQEETFLIFQLSKKAKLAQDKYELLYLEFFKVLYVPEHKKELKGNGEATFSNNNNNYSNNNN